MYLFFDTETTGIPRNYNAPVTDVDNWPRIVQVGWVVYDNQNLLYERERIVRPDGFTISEEVSKIHGITQEKALTDGGLLFDVLDHFNESLAQCDLIVGHNLTYDLNVMGSEYIRAGRQNPFDGKKQRTP